MDNLVSENNRLRRNLEVLGRKYMEQTRELDESKLRESYLMHMLDERGFNSNIHSIMTEIGDAIRHNREMQEIDEFDQHVEIECQKDLLRLEREKCLKMAIVDAAESIANKRGRKKD